MPSSSLSSRPAIIDGIRVEYNPADPIEPARPESRQGGQLQGARLEALQRLRAEHRGYVVRRDAFMQNKLDALEPAEQKRAVWEASQRRQAWAQQQQAGKKQEAQGKRQANRGQNETTEQRWDRLQDLLREKKRYLTPFFCWATRPITHRYENYVWFISRA